MARFVNASSQRVKAFSDIQADYPPTRTCGRSGVAQLRLFHDVETRWNSMCLMLICAVWLRETIDTFFAKAQYHHRYWQLQMSESDWKIAGYFLELTLSYAI
jgi:hypothetical protein